MTISVTIELPASIKVALGDTGKETVVPVGDIAKTHPDVIRFAALNGFIGALNNVSRGKDDETGAANSDDVWASARAKRVDVWLRGEWAGRGGGGREAGGQLDAYMAERLAAGATMAKVKAAMRDTVASVFGFKPGGDGKQLAEPVTFDNFLRAAATLAERKENAKAKPSDEAVIARYEALAETWTAKADALRAERAKAGANVEIDVEALGL